MHQKKLMGTILTRDVWTNPFYFDNVLLLLAVGLAYAQVRSSLGTSVNCCQKVMGLFALVILVHLLIETANLTP